MNNIELIEKAIELLKKGKMKENGVCVADMLIKYVECNTTMKMLRKLSVKDIPVKLGKGEAPNFRHGVYYDSDNKVAVATDGKHIFVNPLEYTDEYGKNVIVGKDGNVIKCRFPNYKSLLPMKDDMKRWKELDFGGAETLVRKAIHQQAVDCLEEDVPGEPYITGFGVDLGLAIKVVPTIVFLGTDGWFYKDGLFYKRTDDGREFAFMGVHFEV